MENTSQCDIIKKLMPHYLAVAEASLRPGDVGNNDHSYGNEMVLVLDEYRKRGKDFEPRFDHSLEDHGIRVDHGEMSFLMRLTSARETFAKVTGTTFKDFLEAHGQDVSALFENSAQELKAIRNKAAIDRMNSPEYQEERAARLAEEQRNPTRYTEQTNMFEMF